jgi:hypothetical protein
LHGNSLSGSAAPNFLLSNYQSARPLCKQARALEAALEPVRDS